MDVLYQLTRKKNIDMLHVAQLFFLKEANCKTVKMKCVSSTTFFLKKKNTVPEIPIFAPNVV